MLAVVVAVIGVVGVIARLPGAGALPAPCDHSALRDGVIVCGAGDPVEGGAELDGRAWLFGRKLDVNRASAGDLERISGVGPSLAARIVEERTRRGRFASLDELDDVDGVGPKLLAKLALVVEVR
jgi:competence protein ComEA